MPAEAAQKVDNSNSTESKSETGQKNKDEAWGYDLYPERRGTFKAKISNILIGKEGKENIEKYKCEKNVYECIKTSKLALGKHVSCLVH